MTIRFERVSHTPLLGPREGSFASVHVANPDVAELDGVLHVYFRGRDEGGHDQIGLATAQVAGFDGTGLVWHPASPLVRVPDDEAAHDAGHILDPAVVRLGDDVLLYYTAHPGTQHASAGASTGLAVSRDGIRFDRSPAPVVDGYAPEAVVSDGVVHLLFQREAAAGGFEVFLRTSSDGRDFSAKAEQRVFGGSGVAGAFDERSVATGRIWREGDWWVMAYAGCRRFLDYPEAVGLARSRDLRDWERYPGNPVLERGEPGTWDEGALWFPTVHVVGDTRWMFYEGCGAGLGTDTARARVTSAAVRDADYGGYDVVSFSSIGLARHTGPVAEW